MRSAFSEALVDDMLGCLISLKLPSLIVFESLNNILDMRMKYEHIIQSVKAQTTPTPFTPITSMSPENLNCGGPVTISCALGYIVSILINLAGAIAVIYLIYSGILFITAASNPDQAKRGQQGVVNAIIGIIIVMTARIIVAAVVNTFSR